MRKETFDNLQIGDIIRFSSTLSSDLADAWGEILFIKAKSHGERLLHILLCEQCDFDFTKDITKEYVEEHAHLNESYIGKLRITASAPSCLSPFYLRSGKKIEYHAHV